MEVKGININKSNNNIVYSLVLQLTEFQSFGNESQYISIKTEPL